MRKVLLRFTSTSLATPRPSRFASANEKLLPEELSSSRIISTRLSGRLKLFKFCTTRFQLILPVDSQNLTKNQTGNRMHVKGPQICQINRWNNSIQNMYGMLKATIDRLARKIDFVQKKHLIFAYFGGHESELPDFGRTWTPNR